MNHNDKILVSLAAGIVLGAVLGILLAGDKGYEKEKDINAQSNKIVEDALGTLRKRNEKSNSMQDEIDEAVKEAFADDPDEYD